VKKRPRQTSVGGAKPPSHAKKDIKGGSELPYPEGEGRIKNIKKKGRARVRCTGKSGAPRKI